MGIFLSFLVFFFAQTTAPLVRTYQNNDDLMLKHIHAKILINLLSFSVASCRKDIVEMVFFSILWVLLSHIAQHSIDNSQKMGIGVEVLERLPEE